MGVAVRDISLRAAGDNICNLSEVGVAPSLCLKNAGLERVLGEGGGDRERFINDYNI